MGNEYQASDIQVLEGLNAVRVRPGMYIGSTGSRGLHHMLWEIVDNAIDEAMGGYADLVTVTLNQDGSATVTDNGRGVPTDIHPTMKVSGVEVVYTQLHAGGKFGGKSYTYSGGLHGVGASVVNALSSFMTVEVYRDGKAYRIEFESKAKGNKKVAPGVPKGPLQMVGKSAETGTKVTFQPDPAVFDTVKWNRDTIDRRLRELAYLNRGLRVEFADLREAEAYRAAYHFEGGIADYVRYLNEDKTPLSPAVMELSGSRDDVTLQCAIQFTDGYTESLFSYVNNIPTTEGGTHETGFKTAMTKVLNEYARKTGTLKEKDKPLSGEDFREGMTAVLCLKMTNVQFDGQTKTRLGNVEARKAVEAIVGEQLGAYLEDPDQGELIGKILEKAVKAARVRDAARRASDLAREKNALDVAPLVGKLSACSGKNAEANELFIVEGDSAGGSAKQGRDRRFQAILPLRGKPLNAEKKRLDAVLANEEFRTIIAALGCGIDEHFTVDTLKYHKVIILSDADQDGAHIRAILLTFFFRYMKDLVTQGHVYIGQPPLYKVAQGSKVTYCYDDKELARVTQGLSRGYTLQRYKGLGEMNPEQLWETTMNPDGRKLVQVTIEDAAEADRLITLLMGDKVEPRRVYIAEHADFNRQDDFEKMGGGR